MDKDDPIFKVSETDLRSIADWYASIYSADERPPKLLLVGGWAVWCYNPYYPSIDIDIVASSKVRRSLFHYLRYERGFRTGHSIERNVRVFKRNFNEQEIVIDYDGPRTPGEIEGTKEKLTWKSAIENSIVKKIGNGFLHVPERGILILHKLKAVVERSYRLGCGQEDRTWLLGKLAKDRADILALADNEKGNPTVDVNVMGAQLKEVPFLIDDLEDTPNHSESYQRYGCSRARANEIIERLISLIK